MLKLTRVRLHLQRARRCGTLEHVSTLLKIFLAMSSHVVKEISCPVNAYVLERDSDKKTEKG